MTAISDDSDGNNCSDCGRPTSSKRRTKCESCRKTRKPLKLRECRQCGSDDLQINCQLCDKCRATPNPRCKRCKKVQPLSRFSHDATRPSGHFPWCKSCQQESSGKFQDPEADLNGYVCPLDDVEIRGHKNRRFCSDSCKARATSLKNNFGLAPEQYRALIPEDRRCPICRNRPTRWNVDHDHTTGLVMGAVCTACNIGALASTYHDPEFVRRLLDFLENPPSRACGADVIVPKGPRSSNLHNVWNYKKASCRK